MVYSLPYHRSLEGAVSMKPKKLSRFLSAVLALALVAGLMPAAFAAEGEDII